MALAGVTRYDTPKKGHKASGNCGSNSVEIQGTVKKTVADDHGVPLTSGNLKIAVKYE
jgi:hypothetical protein